MNYRPFDRDAALLIGTSSAQTGVSLEGLRIEFDVKRSRQSAEGSSPNSATITVYNLSENTRNRLSDMQQAKGYIVLQAGYKDEDGRRDIFRGDISTVTHGREGTEIKTAIVAEDGRIAMLTKVSKSYRGGIKAKTILRELVDLSGIDKKKFFIPDDFPDIELVAGFAHVGPVAQALDKICGILGLEWSIQNGEMKIVQAAGTDQITADIISPTSGMLDSPKRKEDKEAGTRGWIIRSLLRPKVEPASLIMVSSIATGENKPFAVESVKHSGDTFGDTWESEIEVIG